ncbi:PelD GGDEF domain-containing protein [Stutzerimonas stutzeri]|uniref:PelD GGDEF domain-containing protein n=1 Tax=Stutzerimonas stutzeri TaxID=316 RepID=UPI002109F1C2|nr:PelD GGDEF domain-containing protein [Stutzerimonas stutzeri]MCQ4260755.1 sugar transporter [Stutzerimonas stutzeri]
MALGSAHKDFTLAPRASTAVSWLETWLITGLAIGIGYWLMPGDPLMVENSFPWPVLAPLLLGMRYGFMRGLVSAVLLILALIAYHRFGDGLYAEMPASFIVGVLVSGMLVGEFRDIWERRLERLDLANDYRQLRLDEFTRAHYILRISHDRLEQRIAGNDQSLRSSLVGLRNQLRSLPRGDDPLAKLADPVLSLLTQYGSFRSAGLYRVKEGVAVTAPLSVVGDTAPMDQNDLLLRMCLKRGELVSIREELLERGEHREHSRYQLCVPLIDTDGRILAILAVEQMPFFSFNDRVFGLLSILAGHIADLILSDPQTLQLQDMDSQVFSQNLKRSLSDAQFHGLDASLFMLEVNASPYSEKLLRLIEDSRRGLDLQLRAVNQRGNTCVLVLLPLTSAEGAQGYLFRLNILLAERFGADETLESLQVRVLAHDIGTARGHESIHHFLYSECALNDQQVAV